MLTPTERERYEEKVAAKLDTETAKSLARDSLRYEVLRQMTPAQFAAHHARWIAGDPADRTRSDWYFSDLVDELAVQL